MNSPKITFLLTLVGILAAGLPLLRLTRPAEHHHHDGCCCHHHHAHGEEHHDSHAPAYADLRFDGEATIELLHRGRLLLTATQSPAECRLPLADEQLCELEVRGTWAQEGEHAVSIRLEAPHREEQNLTRWTHGKEMHDVFIFTTEQEHAHEH